MTPIPAVKSVAFKTVVFYPKGECDFTGAEAKNEIRLVGPPPLPAITSKVGVITSGLLVGIDCLEGYAGLICVGEGLASLEYAFIGPILT